MEALDERTLSDINNYLFYADVLRVAVKEARELQDARGVTTGGCGHAVVSDPTAQRAIKHATALKSVLIITPPRGEEYVQNPEGWLRLIDKVYNLYENQLVGKCMKLRYVQHKNPLTIMVIMGISKNTYYRWRDEFINDAAMCAVSSGLIDIKKHRKK